MLLKRRKSGSQRSMQELEATIVPILDNRTDEITILAGGVYYTIRPQTDVQMLELYNEMGTAARNRRRTSAALKRSLG